MKVRAKFVWGSSAIAGLVLAVACSNNTNPGGPSGGGGTPPPASTTVTITSTGVNPKNITVPRGTQVTFINSSSVSHEMASDPHPTHGSCPEIENGVGSIIVGQTKQTGNLNTARTCGYHDHNRDQDTSLQGTITIQ